MWYISPFSSSVSQSEIQLKCHHFYTVSCNINRPVNVMQGSAYSVALMLHVITVLILSDRHAREFIFQSKSILVFRRIVVGSDNKIQLALLHL